MKQETKQVNPQGSDLLSSTMVAEILGLSADYIRKLAAAGTIKAVKLGHDWIIRRSDVASYSRKRSKLRKRKDGTINGTHVTAN